MALFIYIFGLLLGSFLSMVFSRLEVSDGTRKPKKRSRKRSQLKEAAFGRSRCDHCRRQIAWYDNIPLVSYLLLRGKCRHCGKEISHYHPVLELATGLFLLANYLYFGLTLQFFTTAVFGMVMLLIFAYDLKHQLIPNVVVGPALALATVLLVYQGLSILFGNPTLLTYWTVDVWSHLLGGLALGGLFLGMAALSAGRWIGGGDVKLGLLIGLLLGWPYVAVATVAAYLVGTVFAVILLITRQAGPKTMVPFGPMLVIGFLIAAYYGDLVIDWYNNLFL